MKWWLPVVCLWVFCQACSKKGNTVSDRELPVIVIATPTANQVFQAGDPILVSGSATDNRKLAELHVHVYNNITGSELIDMHHPANGVPSYAFLESFQAQAGIQYKIQVMAIDESANTAYATVYVSAN